MPLTSQPVLLQMCSKWILLSLPLNPWRKWILSSCLICHVLCFIFTHMTHLSFIAYERTAVIFFWVHVICALTWPKAFFSSFFYVTISNKCILSPDAVFLFSLSLSRGFKVLCKNAMHNAQSCLSASLTRSISHSAHSQCCVKASALCQNHPWIQQEEKASPLPWVGRVLIVCCVSALADSLQSCRAWTIVYSSVLPVLQLIPAHAFCCQGLWHQLGTVGTKRWWRTASLSLLNLYRSF